MSPKFLPKTKSQLSLLALCASTAVGGLLTLWGVYAIETYGFALFIAMPLLMGYTVAVVLGIHPETIRKDVFLNAIGALTLLSIAMLLFAFEGLICIIMAAPLEILMALIGAAIGFEIHKHWHQRLHQLWVLLLVTSPVLMAFEGKVINPTVAPVVTTIDIAAPPQAVWDQIIAFPTLKEPEEWFFKAGLAYPINANIDGQGVGAVRYCNFSTGSFVEPITIWDEPNLLAFDVLDQPMPMVELSPYNIEPPHLHGYFVSVRGQFKLTELTNGGTRLEGTTWYYVDIYPEWYWRIWSDYIIHRIHTRVLSHIKDLSEQPI